MKQLVHSLIGSTVLIVAGASTAVSAELITNGSFETGVVSGIFQGLSAGDPFLTGWTIGGSVDIVGSYWPAQNGNQSVDLNGLGLGSISQSVSLIAGEPYHLSFWLSGNPDGAPDPKTLTVTLGSFSQNISIASPPIGGINWQLFSYDYTPTSTGPAELKFQSTSVGSTGIGGCPPGDGCWGPTLENVSLTGIPEPETYALLLAGLGLLGFAVRQRK